jgi:predicted RNase H-like nuclease (RuvC/YqgF family)
MANLINGKRGRDDQSTRDRRRNENVSSDTSRSDDDSIVREIETSTRDRTALRRENQEMKNKMKELESELQKMKEKAEADCQEIIRKSHEYFKCDGDLSKRIKEYVKKTLFRHVKFITSDVMLNNLQKEMSMANVTMDNFNVKANDRISWWRTCSITVSDAISTQRNQVIMSIKAQVLSK